MRSFSIHELSERSGDLSREAEEGRLSLVTSHGKPLFVSVPFTEDLLEMGVHTSLAVHLFKSGEMTSARAAKLARMSRSQFLEHLSARGVPVVDYGPRALADELTALGDDAIR